MGRRIACRKKSVGGEADGPRGAKRQPREETVFRAAAPSASLGQGDAVELHRAQLVALGFVQIMPFSQHAVEFVDEQGDGFVAFIRLDGGIHVRALNDDAALGLEPGGDTFLGIALQLHTNAHDALVVAKQSVGFFTDKGFQGRGQIEVNAGYDQFVIVLAVHVSALCLG